MRLTSFTAATVAVMAGSALLVAAPGASSADPTRSSAYGVSVTAGGKEVVPPSPFVESTDGSTQTAGGAAAFPPDAAPLLSGDVLALSAGDDKASVEVTDLKFGNLISELPPEVGAGLSELQAACEGVGEAPIEQFPDVIGEIPLPLPNQPTEDELIEFCNGVFDGDQVTLATIETLQVSCEGDSGRVNVVGASALGSDVPANLQDVEANKELFPDNPLISVTLNRQTPGSNGAFTVDGLVVSLGGGEAEAVVASTTCGEGIPQSSSGSTPGAPTAPAPTPQQGSAPVTG